MGSNATAACRPKFALESIASDAVKTAIRDLVGGFCQASYVGADDAWATLSGHLNEKSFGHLSPTSRSSGSSQPKAQSFGFDDFAMSVNKVFTEKPMSESALWLAFSQIDQNEDMKLTKKEFDELDWREDVPEATTSSQT